MRVLRGCDPRRADGVPHLRGRRGEKIRYGGAKQQGQKGEVKMSNAKYDWWGYIKGVIRRYPMLRAECAAVHTQNVIARYGESGRNSSGQPRKTEATAIKSLSPIKQKELESVENAIRKAKSLSSGEDRIKLIDIVFWQRTHTLTGAAGKCYVSERTARRWHTDFIKSVAEFYGFEIK